LIECGQFPHTYQFCQVHTNRRELTEIEKENIGLYRSLYYIILKKKKRNVQSEKGSG
jgi:hypothetical protein